MNYKTQGYLSFTPLFRLRLSKRAEAILDSIMFFTNTTLTMLSKGERRKVKKALLVSMLCSSGYTIPRKKR